MKSHVPRNLWRIFLAVMISVLAVLIYLLLTRAEILRAGYLNPAPGVYFYDDFSRFYSGWDSQNSPQGAMDYTSGRYTFRVEEPNLDLWGTAGLDLDNASIEVDAVRVAGPESGTMGIICRYLDGENFYFGIITGHGYYGIGRYQDGGMRLLSGNALRPMDSVKAGSQVNHLRFDCSGTTLSFYVNGYLLESLEDGAFTKGDVGVIAGSLEEGGVEIAFDDFVVFTP